MTIRILLGWAILLLTPSYGWAGPAAATHALEANRMTEWTLSPSAPIYAYESFRIALTPHDLEASPEPDQPPGDSDWPASPSASVEVQVRREDTLHSATNLSSSYGAGSVGVFMMARDYPVLIVATYSGGAHCCTHFNLLPLEGEPNWAMAGGFEGDSFEIEDIDGDGIFEIARPDPRFAGADITNAGAWASPLILGFREGQLIDVTSQSQYRGFLIHAEKETSSYCGGNEGWFTQGCIAWGGIAHRLGTLQDVLREIEIRAEAAPQDTSMAISGFEAIERKIGEAIAGLTEQNFALQITGTNR